MTRISIITPSYNSGRFIRDCVQSIHAQKAEGHEIEHIVMDGGSSDETLEVLEEFAGSITQVVSEPDEGPADAINKGLARTTGDILCWLNADDIYAPGALSRVCEVFAAQPEAAFVFGHCPIVNEAGEEIRKPITRFKEFYYPLNCRFVFQCINYISQPAMFFRRSAFDEAGPIRLDLKAAWDYEFLLRLWHVGPGIRVQRPELAQFRWHPGSISGGHFETQFNEEFRAAVEDAGRFSLQAFIHWWVKTGIILSYKAMTRK